MTSLDNLSIENLMNFYYIFDTLNIMEFQNIKFAVENEIKKRKLDEKRK